MGKLDTHENFKLRPFASKVRRVVMSHPQLFAALRKDPKLNSQTAIDAYRTLMNLVLFGSSKAPSHRTYTQRSIDDARYGQATRRLAELVSMNTLDLVVLLMGNRRG